MSSNRRRVRRAPSRGERSSDADWWTSSGYYGVWQAFGFGLPITWLAFQSPTAATLPGPAVTVGLYATAMGIAAGRQDHHVGESWPRLSRRKLGTGVGYRRYLRRFCLVAATVSIATFGGVLAGRGGGEFVAAGVAFACGVGVVALVPLASTESPRSRLARASLYLLAGAVTLVVARPLDPATAIASAPVAFGLTAVAAATDLVVDGR